MFAISSAGDIQGRVEALADAAWAAGYRYDAADLILSMSKGATSGEILGELFLELSQQRSRQWVEELARTDEVEAIKELIRHAFRSVGQAPPRG